MRCPHCARDVVAQRTGEGVRVCAGRDRAFVIASRCPYPRCSELVFARVPATRDGLELTTMHDVAAWSPSALFAPVAEWMPLALLLGFAVIPAWGINEAIESVRGGGVAWLLYGSGSLLGMVPVLSFLRGVAFAIRDVARVALDSRAAILRGGRGGMSVVPNPRGAYRSY